MRLAVLIPDRNDRPLFLQNCKRMLDAQTLKPDHIEIINDDPILDVCDITYRYRIGYGRLRNKGFDLIALMENDDWYSPEYLSTMIHNWITHDRPAMLGTSYTIYYHIKIFAHFTFEHHSRSSAMSTMIVPDLNFKWCEDSQPYTDMWLWNNVPGKRIIFTPQKHICMGIKHGEGLCGGQGHKDRLERYAHKDDSKIFLKTHLDTESFNFYSTYYGTR